MHSRVTFLWFIIVQKRRRNELTEEMKTTNKIYYSFRYFFDKFIVFYTQICERPVFMTQINNSYYWIISRKMFASCFNPSPIKRQWMNSQGVRWVWTELGAVKKQQQRVLTLRNWFHCALWVSDLRLFLLHPSNTNLAYQLAHNFNQ